MAIADLVNITDLLDEYVVCRAIGHSWDDNPNGEVDSELFNLSRGVLMLRCVRCLTQRYDYINNEMQVATRYYRYPPRYKSIPGQGTRPNLRGEMLRRSLLFHVRLDGRRNRNRKESS